MWPYIRTYWPCAYPGVVLRHASGPTGPWNSLWFFVPDQIPFPGSSHSHAAPQRKPNPASQKLHLTTTLPWTCKLFLNLTIFADFRGLVCRVKKVQNSTVHANQSYRKESAYTVSEEKDLQKLKSKSPHDEKETEEHVEAGRAHQVPSRQAGDRKTRSGYPSVWGVKAENKLSITMDFTDVHRAFLSVNCLGNSIFLGRMTAPFKRGSDGQETRSVFLSATLKRQLKKSMEED